MKGYEELKNKTDINVYEKNICEILPQIKK